MDNKICIILKKTKLVLLMFVIILSFGMTACGNNESANNKSEKESAYRDMTELSATVIYSEVFNMVADPQQYKGDTIKIKGALISYTDERTGRKVKGCVIKDATQCCAQGFEVVGKDGKELFNGIADGTEIVVEGTFDYEEDKDYRYIKLVDAKFIK
ncbi:MAG: hypothetical protein PUI85_03750 [Eubacteriales bacterium]|nr:hypothetical protein [Eubacteriales bacterium]MDY3332274.1 hypothetical protein [Gallibacter sp.]